MCFSAAGRNEAKQEAQEAEAGSLCERAVNQVGGILCVLCNRGRIFDGQLRTLKETPDYRRSPGREEAREQIGYGELKWFLES